MSLLSPNMTIGGKPVTVYHGSGDGSDSVREVVTEKGIEAVVKLQCFWADRIAVYKGLAGSTVISGTGIYRTPPFAYPDFPGLFCMAITDVKPTKMRTQATGWVTFEFAILTCHFGYPTYGFSGEDPRSQNDPSGQPWTTTRFRVNGEILTVPGNTLYYNAGPQNGLPLEDSKFGLTIPHIEVSMTRHFMPFEPVATIAEFAGSVNLNPVQLGNFSFPKGTLLFHSGNTQPTSDPTGEPMWEVEYMMLGNAVDWNYAIARDGTFYATSTASGGGGNTPYPYVDFFSQLP